MRKTSFVTLVGIIMLTIIFSFAVSTPLIAEEDTEDVMDMSLEDLLDVEITTAGKQAQKISDIPASVVVVTRGDIEKYGYQSLTEILENIPGLYQIDDYLFKAFGVRGFYNTDPNRSVVILLNNVKAFEGIFSGNFIEQVDVPVEAIDRIEVVRGPMSIIYGTGAFFGAINIFTDKVDEKNPINQVSVSFGSEKTYKTALRVSGKEGEFQYAFSGSFYDTEGYDMALNKIAYPETLEGLNIDPNGTTGGLLENNEKFFNFSGKFKGFYFNAMYTEANKEVYFYFPTYDDGFLAKHRATRLSFGYEKQISEKVRLDANFDFSNNNWTLRYDWLRPDFYGNQPLGSSNIDAGITLFFDPSEKLNITVGLDYFRLFDIVDNIDIPDWALIDMYQGLNDGEAIERRAIYGQFNFKLSKKIRIVAGARVEQTPKFTLFAKYGNDSNGTFDVTEAEYDNTDPIFVPRLALLYSINEKNIIKLMYGKATNSPSFFQLLDLLWNPGSTPLDAEDIQTIELNYIGQWSSNFSVSLSLFRNMLDKLIYRSQFINSSGQYVTYYANVGEMTTNGFELTLTSKPSESLFFEVSGTYSDTEDKRAGFENIDVGYSPKFLGYLKASYFFNKDFSLGVTGTYVGEMEAYHTGVDRIGEGVDSYFILGANLRIRNLFDKGVFLNIRGSNLLNQEFHYPTSPNNAGYVSKGTIGREFSFLVSLGWKF